MKCIRDSQTNALAPDMQTSLFNLLSRMSYRSTPYSCFAGVTSGRIAEKVINSIELMEQEKYTITTIQTDRATPKNKTNRDEVFWNPTLKVKGSFLEFYPPLKAGQQRYQLMCIKLPKQKNIDFEGNARNCPLAARHRFLELGILLNHQQFKVLANKGSNSQLFLTDFAKFQAGSRQELYKPSRLCELSESSANELIHAAEILLSIFSHSATGIVGSKSLDGIKNDFITHFHFREVPLLEMLSPTHFIGAKFISGMKEKPLDNFAIEWALNDLVLNAESEGQKLIRLSRQNLSNLKNSLSRLQPPLALNPSSITVVASAVLDEHQQEKFLIRHLRGPQLTSHFVRYLPAHPDIEKHVQDLVSQEKDFHQNVILAEVLHQADRSHLDHVSPELGLHEASLPVSAVSSNRKRVQIALSDLTVFFADGRFRLRSKSWNREVIPVGTNLHNTRVDSHPVYQFLSEIQVQDSFHILSWTWGRHRKLYFPRVEVGRTILSPAMWYLSQNRLHRLKRLSASLDQVRHELFNWGVPPKFNLQIRGSNIHCSLESDVSLTSFLDAIRDLDHIMLEEHLAPALTRGPEGRFINDLVLPLLRKTPKSQDQDKSPQYFFSDVAQKSPKQEECSLAPGSDWTYLKLYLDPALYNDFVSQDLARIMGKKTSIWFFVPYRDPNFHVRLRMKSNQRNEALNQVLKLFRQRKYSHFSLDTYDREIERYGGLYGCKLFEALSKFDCLAVIEFKRFQNMSVKVHESLWFQAAICSCLQYLESFQFSNEELNLLKGRLRKRAGTSLAEKKVQRFLGSTKSLYLGNRAEKSEELLRTEKIYGLRTKRQLKHAKAVLLGLQKKKIGVDKLSYVTSLIHLSLVRLDLNLANAYEDLIVRAACEVFQRMRITN